MTRPVRLPILVVAALILASLILPAIGIDLLGGVFYTFWPPLIFLASIGFIVFGILDAAIHKDSVWRAADQNKIVWILVQLLPLVGTAAYFLAVHPSLIAADTRTASER